MVETDQQARGEVRTVEVLERELEQLLAAGTGVRVGPLLREAARDRRVGLRIHRPHPRQHWLIETDPAAPATTEPAAHATTEAKPTETSPTASSTQPGGALTRLRAALVDLGVTASLIDDLVAASQACAAVGRDGSSLTTGADVDAAETTWSAPGAPTHGVEVGAASATAARAQELLSAVEAVTVLASRLDGVRLSATRSLCGQIGAMLLAEKGISDPGELSKTARKEWRTSARSATRHELEAALGWGPGDVMTLVGLANAPVAVRTPVGQSLARGEASWPLVRAFFRAISGMAHEHGAAVANGLFGDDPAVSVTERLTSDREFIGGPWRAKEFYRALDREVHKIKNQDPDERDAAGRAARASADVRVQIEAEGTAEVTVGTSPAQAAAVADRVERAARAAKAAGDTRTLQQLRSAIATALLLHGTVDLASLSNDPDTLTVEQSDQLTKILYALPTADLNVIVPLDALFGQFLTDLITQGGPPRDPGWVNDMLDLLDHPKGSHGDDCHQSDGHPNDSHAGYSHPKGSHQGDSPHDADRTSTDGAARPDPESATAASDHRVPRSETPGVKTVQTPHSETPGVKTAQTPHSETPGGADCPNPDGTAPSRSGVPAATGEVIGKHSVFLGPDQLWELMLTPGSVLHRLLVDPVSGRCVERSSSGYRFTPAQRAQIHAADGFCRAPGCLRPARLCQIDHVQEFGTPGGDTSEANAQSASDPHHKLKTLKVWDATINARREVTWTTLLGRIYTTKPHDYTQYAQELRAATVRDGSSLEHSATDCAAADQDDQARQQRIDAAIYDALCELDAGCSLTGPEDYEDADAFCGWPLITLTHRDANGRRVYRPDPARQAAARRRHSSSSGTAPGHSAPTGAAQPADEPDLLADIDTSRAIDLSEVDPEHPAQLPEPGEDPYGPARYLPWDADAGEPPF